MNDTASSSITLNVGKFVHEKARKSIEGKAGKSDENISRALRSVKTDDIRKTSRLKRLSLLRGIENIPKSVRSIEVNTEITKNVIKKPSTREEQLKKWKEEKMLKKQLESKAKKRAPFVVPHKMQECQPSVSHSDSHTKKDRFVSKIPRAFPEKLPRIPEVSSQLKTRSGKPVPKFGQTCNTAEKTIMSKSNSKTNQHVVKKLINPAMYKNNANSSLSQPNFASAKAIAENRKVKPSVTKNAESLKQKPSVTNKALKPGVRKDAVNVNPVSRPSFAPPNFVFSPSSFGSICERFEEVAKAFQISTPIKSSRKSERVLNFPSEKPNPLRKKSGLFPVCSSSSNLEKVVEGTVFCSSNPDKVNEYKGSDLPSNPQFQKLSKIDEICTKKNSAVVDSGKGTKDHDLDLKNGQPLITPCLSPSLQHNSNEEVLDSNHNLKEEAKDHDLDLKNGQPLITPCLSPKLQHKRNEEVLDSVPDLKKEAEVNDLDAKVGQSVLTQRRSPRLQHKSNEEVLDSDPDLKKEAKENGLDIMNRQSVLTPRRSMRLQQKGNEEVLHNDLSSVADNLIKEVPESDLDVKNRQSVLTPRRSMRLQHKSNEEVLYSDPSSVADNLIKGSDANNHKMENGVSLHSPCSMKFQPKDIDKEHSADDTSVFYSPKDAKPEKHKIETGVTSRTPRRSMRLQCKTTEKELDASKSPIFNSGKGNKSRKSQAGNLMEFYTPRRSNNVEYSIICEESEPSLVNNSPVDDVEAAPVSTSQKTRLTEDFGKLSLQPFLENIPEIEEQETVFEPSRDFRPSLLYTPIDNAKKSIINVTGDMIVFSPDF